MADVADYIQTHSGKRFHFLNPQPDEIDIEDIAFALAHTPRWGGHCDPPISVAQHCVIVTRLLRNTYHSSKVQLQGLLHDASEAYIPDVPSPYKPYFPDLVAIDKMIMSAIAEKFGLELPFDPAVKKADVESYRWEYRDLMKPMGMCQEPAGNRPMLKPWDPLRSEFEFLAAFCELTWALKAEAA